MGPFSDHPELDDLAHRFFRQFSRMEYALKAAGRVPRLNGRAEADWRRFGAEVDEAFQTLTSKDEELRGAVEYLLNQPPKKQEIADGVLVWRDKLPTGETQTGVVLLCVARVRNNLFHGGKFNGQWIDPQRSLELLPRCLTVLDRLLLLSDEVRAAYEQ
jgi:hypothetical protein